MRPHAWTLIALLSAGGAACGDGAKMPDPQRRAPTPFESNSGDNRPDGGFQPTRGEPSSNADAGIADALSTACCMVSFAIADDSGDEPAAVLRGEDAPLNTGAGVALSYSSGAWRASVCMPMLYQGYYYYNFGRTDATTGEVIIDVRSNPFAPTGFDFSFGRVNVFSSVSSCGDPALDAHAKIN